MPYNLHFSSSKCRLFHNATLFGFCTAHILNTGCAKIKKKIRRQKVNANTPFFWEVISRKYYVTRLHGVTHQKTAVTTPYLHLTQCVIGLYRFISDCTV